MAQERFNTSLLTPVVLALVLLERGALLAIATSNLRKRHTTIVVFARQVD